MARHHRKTHRKTQRKMKLFGRVYSPFHHLLQATRNVGKTAFTATGGILNQGIRAVDNMGMSIADHADQAVRNVVRRRKDTRKNRKDTRKNRKDTRKNRKH
jgi:hypothetical protein